MASGSFDIKIYCGGKFIYNPRWAYSDGKFNVIKNINPDYFD